MMLRLRKATGETIRIKWGAVKHWRIFSSPGTPSNGEHVSAVPMIEQQMPLK